MPKQIDRYKDDYLMKRLDAAVAEVFELMLGMSCLPLEEEHESDKRITVQIQFSGGIEGGCLLCLGSSAGEMTMEALLGECHGECDSMMMDAAAELCNMIVGSWKSKLDPSMASASLSIPTISHDTGITIQNQSGRNLLRSYCFRGNTLGIVIYL
jgi:CheY-specific phosphatase CheX